MIKFICSLFRTKHVWTPPPMINVYGGGKYGYKFYI